MARTGARKRGPAKAPKKATLQWLKIHQLRHVEPCELRFSDTYNVLLGLNGTGKTTLLDLIAAALSFNFSKMQKEAFFIEYEIASPEATIRASVRNEVVSAGQQGDAVAPIGHFPGSGPSFRPSAELVICGPSEAWPMSIRVKDTGAEMDVGRETSSTDILRANFLYGPYFLVYLWRFLLDPVRLDGSGSILSALGMWGRARRFDEALEFLHVITGASTEMRVVKSEGKIAKPSAALRGLIPYSIHMEIYRQAQEWQSSTVPVVTMTQEHVKLLSKMSKMLGFKNVELRLTHLKTEVNGSDESMSFGELKFMLERADGSVIPHKLLSYGQKRALAFLYYLALFERTVIADELVDGLHHGWIVDCIEAIGDRQAFLASQNPLLLDYLEFGSAEQVRTSFVQCRLKKRGKTERMAWSNMSEYDAERFFEAYGVGLQHVSEILRTKGLW